MSSLKPLVQGALMIALCAACSRSRATRDPGSTAADTTFAAMQQRGRMAMGVDQSTSTHRFDALPDGGRIELQRDTNDSLDVARIRAHLHLIQHAFQSGDFSTPQFVHMQTMPGTAIMAQKRDVITYAYHDLPRGGEVVMSTGDTVALMAIHSFMGAQRMGHHAGGIGANP